jgi:hypothetical protein
VAGIATEARFELRSSNIVMAGLDPAIHENRRPGAIPAFFLAVIARSEASKRSRLFARLWIASRSLSSGAHSRDPLARNDGPWHR